MSRPASPLNWRNASACPAVLGLEGDEVLAGVGIGEGDPHPGLVGVLPHALDGLAEQGVPLLAGEAHLLEGELQRLARGGVVPLPGPGAWD